MSKKSKHAGSTSWKSFLSEARGGSNDNFVVLMVRQVGILIRLGKKSHGISGLENSKLLTRWIGALLATETPAMDRSTDTLTKERSQNSWSLVWSSPIDQLSLRISYDYL